MTAQAGDTLNTGSAATPPSTTSLPPGEGGTDRGAIGAVRATLSSSESPARLKTELRRQLRRLRTAIPAPQRRRCQRQAALKLLRWRGLRQARDIAVYLSVRSELSTAPLIELLLRRPCSRLWVPVTGAGGRMRFARLRRGSRLRTDALGLPRPVRGRPLRTARSLDLVLLPLLAFDARGRRLGNGGGYYDRALAGAAARPLRLGYAYAAQEVPAVPAEPWDVKLDAVVTERGLRHFR
jgi:5-formyltetrahydrofolate cyclo-ligase